MNADKLLEASRTPTVHRFFLTDIISLTVIPRFPHLCFNFSFSSIWCSAIPYFKWELRGKNEVILYSRPIFSTSKFGNSFH